MSDPVGGGLWTAAGGVPQGDSRACRWSPALHVPPMCPGPLTVTQGHRAAPGQRAARGSDPGGGFGASACRSGPRSLVPRRQSCKDKAAWFAETTHGGKTSRKVTDSLWTWENKKATEVSGLSLIAT